MARMNPKPYIAVVGSANVDLTTFTDRIPRPGETILGREFHLGFGGKGANQALAAGLCGAEVSMIARVGDDLFGPATLDNLKSLGIDTKHVLITPKVSSGVAPIFVDSSGQNRILVVKGANDSLSPADIEAASNVLLRADIIIMQLEVPLETVYFTLHFARQQGIRTILNPAPAQPLDTGKIAQAEYINPNETEAATLAETSVGNLEEAKSCAQTLIARGMRRIIMTLGANGALLASHESLQHVPSFAVQAVDTSGAGDAFIGCLAFSLASGCQELEAIRRANLYAALSTLKAGTQASFPSREQFEAEWTCRVTGSVGMYPGLRLAERQRFRIRRVPFGCSRAVRYVP